MALTHEPIGRGLGRSLAVATAIGMVVFGIVVGIALYVHEINDTTPDDPPIEIVQEVAVGLAFALPIGIGLSLLIGRRLTRSTTDRLDEVISTAARLSGESLHERLPIGPDGDALDDLSIALNGAFERIEAGVGAQRQFAADASHELRTPIAVMLTNLEIARRKPRENAHWENVADGVLDELRRVVRLVDKLLMLARTGDTALHRAQTDLRGIADLAVERAKVIAESRGISIELAASDPLVVDIDADAISMVIDNLLRNAIDHSNSGEQIMVRIESEQQLVVEDRGPGVPSGLRERIFQPFARGAHRNTDRAAGSGVGLGLSICKRIVDGHGGSIFVEDRAGGGARFVMKL